MSLKSQNSGTKRMSLKALWLRQFCVVSFVASLFAVQIFCSWVNRGALMGTSCCQGNRIIAGIYILQLMSLGLYLLIIDVWKHRTHLNMSHLKGEVG